jgi:hypothetical protein
MGRKLSLCSFPVIKVEKKGPTSPDTENEINYDTTIEVEVNEVLEHLSRC